MNFGIKFENIIDKCNKKKCKEINLIYIGKGWYEQIFGDEFVKNNENNIDLLNNGIKKDLINECILKKGKNNIKMIIKNKLTNLEGMFKNVKH